MGLSGQDGPPTVEECANSAARLLREAELSPDLARMSEMDSLADTWIRLGEFLTDRDRV